MLLRIPEQSRSSHAAASYLEPTSPFSCSRRSVTMSTLETKSGTLGLRL